MPNYNPVAIVTGAGSGIGKHTTLALWKAGYAVVLAGRRASILEQTVAEAGIGDDRALVIPTDISDPVAVENLFVTAQAKYPHLDLLFNNAGTNTPATPLDEMTLEQWQRVVQINLTGTFLCTQHAFAWMKSQQPQGGRIINNGSISAHAPRPYAAAYNATKHAITGLTQSTSLEGRPYNIACGQIDIGNASTDMTAKMKNGVPQANGSIMEEPTMDVQHVADAIVYMAQLPLNANVQFMTIMATTMPYMGRG